MIDVGHIGIGRVSVHGLTLSVVEEKLLICVHSWDQSRRANSAALLGHQGLHSLEVVSCVQLLIVHVVVLMWVLLNGLVESGEGVVDHWAFTGSSDDGIKAEVNAVVDLESTIACVLTLVM